jgi:hypothetical protein
MLQKAKKNCVTHHRPPSPSVKYYLNGPFLEWGPVPNGELRESKNVTFYLKELSFFARNDIITSIRGKNEQLKGKN